MRRLLAHPMRVAVLATAVLGGVLLGAAIDTTSTAYAVVYAATGATAAAAALGMAAGDSFGARLTAGLTTSMTGLIALVIMTVGAPHNASGDVSLAGMTLVACGILVPTLLRLDYGSSPVGHPDGQPYAP